MQARKPSNSQPAGRKGAGSRVGTQPNSGQSHQPVNSAAKQKEDALVSLIKQFLQKNGYPRTYQTFKTQKPIRKSPTANYNVSKNSVNSQDEQKIIIQNFDKGQREQFFKHTNKIFSNTFISNLPQQQAHFIRRLEFELHIYFCIYSIHPCTSSTSKKTHSIEKNAAEAFKKFIETKGSEISDQGELLVFFSLPYIPKPQDNPTMARVFTKQWLQKLKATLQQTLKEHMIKSTGNAANKQNKKSSWNSSLQQIYDFYVTASMNESKSKYDYEQKQSQILAQINSKYEDEIRDLRNHNKELLSYWDIMKQNLKDLNQASKANLLESNKKWFQISKQILHLTKRAIKGDKEVAEKLQKYQKFFGLNIDDLIYSSNDISIFEKNSYFTEDVSMFPGDAVSKKGTNQVQNQKSLQQNPQITPIDVNKISLVFNKCDKPEFQKQICLILKALKDRLYFHKSAVLKRQVIVQYQRNDICAIKQNNYHLQKKLLFEGGEKVREFYLRLMNHISTDNLGNQYLSGSEKLIENLIGLMGTTTEDIVYRKHVFGILQRLSFIKQSQLTMISFGVIPMIFKIFRNESEQLQYSSIQYLMGLIMNLAIKKQSIVNFEKHKSEIFPILLKFIDSEDNQIRGYVNGTFYVLLQLQSIRRQALQKYHLKQIIQNLLQSSEQATLMDNDNLHDEELEDDNSNIVIRQYRYILERLQETGVANLDATEEDDYDDEEDDYDQDFEEDMDMASDNESNSSEYIEGQENSIKGEQLLMQKYALLGPEAVRQQFLTRSILDDTSRKSHNMTTSINHSKRIDKVFHKNEGCQSVLGGKLDLSITPTR